MSVEIERKFLVAKRPDFLEGSPTFSIKQGYIAAEEGGNEVRVRDKSGVYWMTVKSGGGIVRTEVEFQIAEADFQQLWALTEGRRIEKDRYIHEEEGRQIEIDQYRGALEGLWVAEIEFASREEAEEFRPSFWMGKEITFNKTYKNRSLATGVKFEDLKSKQ